MPDTPSSASFVWCDDQGTGRNLYVLFRRSFRLSRIPSKAELTLFADTRYRLRVNGRIVAYGPGRFVPAHPQFDCCDLAPWLQEGDNVVAVEVNSYGACSFQAMPDSIGGFVAWGSWETGDGEKLDLSTPGDWTCMRSDAMDRDAHTYSFAQGPVEILDTRILPPRWDQPGSADKGWERPVPLARQDAWGPLELRRVPALDLLPITPANVVRAAPIVNGEQRIICRVRSPEGAATKRNNVRVRFCYASWVFSPSEQSVDVGLFWGPHYLNGTELRGSSDPRRGNRTNVRADFQSGWNLLYGEVEVLSEIWGLLIGLPEEAGLSARAERDLSCPDALLYSTPLREPDFNRARPQIPTDAAQLRAIEVEWHRLPIGAQMPMPAREFAWDLPSDPILENSHDAFPLRLDPSAHREWTVVADMAAEFLGHISVDLEAPCGTIIDVASDERLRPDGALALYTSNPFTNSTDRIITSGGRATHEFFHTRGGRYLQVTLRFPEGSEPSAVLHQVSVRRAQVMVDRSGSFSCSDPILNWAWQTGFATLQACVEETYLDCPWRERGLYLGDALVEFRVHRSFSRDLSVARRSIELFAQAQVAGGQVPCVVPSHHLIPHEDFTQIWVLLLHDYWAWTGDLSLAETYWPRVEGLVSLDLESAPSGLWNAVETRVFVDWGATPDSKRGLENACLNAFRIRALECASNLAEARGLDPSSWRERASSLRAAFQDRLWWEDRDRFAAARSPEGDGFLDTPSLHANVLALAWDLGTPEQMRRIESWVLDALARNCAEACTHDQGSGHLELYFQHYAYLALYRRGHFRQAEALIQAHWGTMMRSGAWTAWEAMSRGWRGTGSLCHAWSCAPVWVMSAEILGLSPATPGNLDHLRVSPTGETIDWAAGEFPHPRGTVSVRWRVDGAFLRVSLGLPPGVTCEVVPRGRLADLRLCLAPSL